jgi:hypothetical protein
VKNIVENNSQILNDFTSGNLELGLQRNLKETLIDGSLSLDLIATFRHIKDLPVDKYDRSWASAAKVYFISYCLDVYDIDRRDLVQSFSNDQLGALTSSLKIMLKEFKGDCEKKDISIDDVDPSDGLPVPSEKDLLTLIDKQNSLQSDLFLLQQDMNELISEIHSEIKCQPILEEEGRKFSDPDLLQAKRNESSSDITKKCDDSFDLSGLSGIDDEALNNAVAQEQGPSMGM